MPGTVGSVLMYPSCLYYLRNMFVNKLLNVIFVFLLLLLFVIFQLDYKADQAKIKEVFKMAGKVRNIDLAVDKDGNSRGFAVIEYDHPVEAVQVIIK